MALKSYFLATSLVAISYCAPHFAMTQAGANPAPVGVTPTGTEVPSQAVPPEPLETVVVTAQRSRNSVAGTAVPETTLATADIQALGASNVAEILSSLGARVGSGRGRGGGQPVVLLNGRRVSGFGELRNLPSEAILRVEVFPEETALQYGFSAEQRVVNFILREQFRAITVEGSLGLSANGDRSEDSPEFNFVNITKNGRMSANLDVTQSSAITEAQRNIVRSGGLNDKAFRTILPETSIKSLNFNYARNAINTVGATFDVRYDTILSESLLGLRSLGSGDPALVRTNESETARVAATLDGASNGWQWTATGTFETSSNETLTQIASGSAQTAQSKINIAEIIANASGPLISLPAGAIRGSVRVGHLNRELDSRSQRFGVETNTALTRGDTTSRFTLSVPITSRREDFGAALGDLSLNATASFTELTDFGSLQSNGFGVTWAPIADLRLSANIDRAASAPSIQQLGNPIISTPNSAVFDYATGQTVFVTRTNGGNPTLKQESRDDITFSLNYAPQKVEGLDFNFSWARNKSENPVGSLAGLTPDLEAAFGERFTRDNGRLVSIDQRAVNFAASENEIIRYGVSYGRSFGQPSASSAGAGPPGPGRPPAVGETPQQQRPVSTGGGPRGPSGGGGAGRGGGFAGGGFGGFGGGPPGGPPGRWSISVFHTIRLVDSVTLRASGPALDLLGGASIDDNGGPRRNIVDIEGGWTYQGLGFRATGNWRSGSTIDNGVSDLNFDDYYALNLRLFLNFDSRPKIIAKADWLRRSRLIVRIDNLTDTVQRVTDNAGLTPEAYQAGYLAPRGRFIEIAFRKQF